LYAILSSDDFEEEEHRNRLMINANEWLY